MCNAEDSAILQKLHFPHIQIFRLCVCVCVGFGTSFPYPHGNVFLLELGISHYTNKPLVYENSQTHLLWLLDGWKVKLLNRCNSYAFLLYFWKQWQAVLLPLSLTSLMYAGSFASKFLFLMGTWKDDKLNGEACLFKCITPQWLLGWIRSISSNVLAWRTYVVVSITFILRPFFIPH